VKHWKEVGNSKNTKSEETLKDRREY
jgi:hypothetical protein